MKNLFYKFLTHTLFFGIMFGLFPKVHAGWFTFPEELSLTKEQQRTLKGVFFSSLAGKLHAFSEELNGHTLQQLQAQSPDLTLDEILYRHLWCWDRKQIDLDSIFSAEVYNSDAEVDGLQAFVQPGDGLINGVIRETLKRFVKAWSQEQMEEVFEVFYTHVTEFNDWMSISEDEVITDVALWGHHADLHTHFHRFKQAEGDHLCLKLAHYLTNGLKLHDKVGKPYRSVNLKFYITGIHALIKVLALAANTQ
ncbi:MAG: hypothetical protein LBD69_02425 [Puniceicoccales bacterium]|jgi:hypothetical protein|nr:hypothetical protein [Puniceicoccales bacterium]